MFELTTPTKLRIARAISRVISTIRPSLARCPVVVRKRGGFVWELDLTEGIDLAIFVRGRFEPDVQRALQRLVRPGHTVCDVGANIGAHTLALASFVGPTGTVFAFEPTEFAYAKLLKNLALNPGLEKVVQPLRIALARSQDAPKKESYYSSWPILQFTDQLHPIHGGSPRSADDASVDTLDEVVRRQGLERMDTIKIDVDGDELEVLQGAADTLTRFRPAVIMEYAPYLLADNDEFLEAMINFIQDIGYGITTLNRKNIPLEPDRLRGLVPHGVGRNILLSPQT